MELVIRRNNIMAIYKLTRKTFSVEYIQAAAEKKAGKLNVPLAQRVAELKAQNAAAEAQKVAARAARKDVGNVFQKEVGQIAQGASQKGYQKGVQEGIKSVGIKQGMMNTWNNAGKMGKAGMVGAGVAGTALLAKGLFGGKKQQPQQVAN